MFGQRLFHVRKGVRMNLLRILPLACLLAAGAAQAQSAGECPQLPGDANLTWSAMTGDDFVFCKALREDGGEVFAVMISKDSPFDPRRADRAEKAVIDGHQTRWYRGEIASAPNAEVREALIELDDGRVAHISLHADSKPELAEALDQAQSLRFRGPQLSSN